jgi:hypothetical protein
MVSVVSVVSVAVWNLCVHNNDDDAVVELILSCCCDTCILFKFSESGLPHFGHSSDDRIISIDLYVSIRGVLHTEQKYRKSGYT